jgi:hypothetical protein
VKPDPTLAVTSLLAILLTSFHLSDDVVRGFEPGGFKNINGILILAVWLYGTLALRGTRPGYIIVLLGSLLGSVIPLAHMRGAGLVGGRVAQSAGMHFWVWTLIALGATAAVSCSLSALGLWRLRRRPSPSPGA